MIAGCLNVFDCEATLGKTLRSIQNFVDYIIVVDGSYEGFSDHNRSQDRTMMLVAGFPKPKIQIGNSTGKGWTSEVVKRNLYLYDPEKRGKGSLIDADDWVFIIDADEYIESGVEETLDFLQDSKEKYHSVHMVSADKHLPPYARTLGDRVRLFRYVPGMRYIKNHFTIEYPDGSIMPLKASPAPLQIVHDNSRWTSEYREARRRYDQETRPRVETIE